MKKSVVFQKKNRGFTLVEVLVATFVFVIAMSAVSHIFVSAFSAYREEKIVEDNLENAQFIMNTMAKELRGSSIVSPSTDTNVIKFYNYGLKTCFIYNINSSGSLMKGTQENTADTSSCNSAGVFPSTPVLTGVSGSSFSTFPSQLKTVGKVTILLKIGGSSGSHPALVQTTVSLRDYEVSGL